MNLIKIGYNGKYYIGEKIKNRLQNASVIGYDNEEIDMIGFRKYYRHKYANKLIELKLGTSSTYEIIKMSVNEKSYQAKVETEFDEIDQDQHNLLLCLLHRDKYRQSNNDNTDF